MKRWQKGAVSTLKIRPTGWSTVSTLSVSGGGGGASSGWLGKIAGALAGAHPTAPNSAGKEKPPAPVPPPGAAASGPTPGPGNNGQGTPGNNVGVNIENMHVASPDHGQQVAGDLNASYASQMATR
jgi:hypothetical protein